MINIDGILQAVRTNPGRSTAMVGGGAALAGLATGMLAGKSGRKFAGKAAKYGAVAALGGLAYHAISRHKSGQNAAQPGAPAAGAASDLPPGVVPTPVTTDYESAQPGTAFLPEPETEQLDHRARSLLRAMICAAKADGSVTELEWRRMQSRLADSGVDEASQAFLREELQKPLNIDDIVVGLDGEEHAAEIYAASLVAIDRHGPVERSYLQLLAARLGLDEGLVKEIHRSAEQEEPVHAAPASNAAAPLQSLTA